MMPVAFNKNEHYTTIVLKYPSIDNINKQEVLDEVRKHIGKVSRNFILIPRVDAFTPELSILIKLLHDEINGNSGIFVVARPVEDMEQTLDEMGIVYTPTLDEAIDYVFMEDISRQLGSPEEDEENFGNWY